MKWRPYPKYKPSGVEWLGDVPEHWEVKRLKYLVSRKDEKVEADENNPLPYIGLEHIESWTGHLLPLSAKLVPTGISNHFQAGDTLFGKLRPYLAKACNVDFEGLCSSELLVLRGNGRDQRFLLYRLLAEGFIERVNASTYGAKMPRASWDFIGSCILPEPPIPEQTAIADFLDRETGRIDTLVAKKQTLIERLKEKRTALISRTVTRGLPPDEARKAGLDPHPRLKPSGVEWLGDVPEGWEVKRLGYFAPKIGSGKTPRGGAETYQEKGVLLLRSQNIHNSGLRLLDAVFIDASVDEEMAGTRVQSGDILLNITGASLGRCSIAPIELPPANVNQHVCIIRIDRSIANTRFVHFSIISRSLQEQIFSFENGSSREGLNFQQVRSLVLTIPPLHEQTAIADFLDRETAKIDRLISKIETAIERLREYRTALISAAVTGKIDVGREAA